MISSDNRFIAISNKTLQDHLSQRITNNPNLISDDEVSIHDCLVMDEFLRKNKDIKCNISENRRIKKALKSLQIRGFIIKNGSFYSLNPGRELLNYSYSHISDVPISNFHNAELIYIAIESRKRSSFNIYKSRGRLRHPFQVIPRFNHPQISSESSFFRNLRPTIEQIRNFLYSMVNNKSYTAGNRSVQQSANEAVINRPQTVAVEDGGQSNTTFVPPISTEFLLNCSCLGQPQRKRFGRDVHTGSHKVEQENDLIDRFVRLKAILGRNPEFVELYDAGFIREEIDLLELILDVQTLEQGSLYVEVVA
jgi:hypothetical protein